MENKLHNETSLFLSLLDPVNALNSPIGNRDCQNKWQHIIQPYMLSRRDSLDIQRHKEVESGMMARDTSWETVWKFIKKLNTELPNEAGHSTSGYKPLRAESRVSKRYVYSYVHSSIIHKSQNMTKTQCPLMDKWIKEKKNQLWSVCRTWYYGALKRKELCNIPQHGWTLRTLC